MYSMKDVCSQLNISYDTLKFYCNQGLIPNVQRDKNNYRVFNERNIQWIKTLKCLKKCGMSIKDMKVYMDLCLQGIPSIPQRKKMLDIQKNILLKQRQEIDESLAYIDWKHTFYNEVLSGEREYTSNLIDIDE